jgi:EAL domain-containing protein (putative c-di-GMP-specific phosphodiesterase class I)
MGSGNDPGATSARTDVSTDDASPRPAATRPAGLVDPLASGVVPASVPRPSGAAGVAASIASNPIPVHITGSTRGLASFAPASGASLGLGEVNLPPGAPPSGSLLPAAPTVAEQAVLDNAVRESISADTVSVAFQPIFNMLRRRVFAYEALARPEHPAFSGNPALLFHTAARLGLAGQLGRRVREKAALLAPNVPLFFNIHPSELNAPYIVRPDDPVFTHTDGVYLEVTEQVPLKQYAMCKPMLTELGARGVNLVVDDLGAGYSNLKYIADLQPKMVKLDRELIIGLQVGSRLFRLVTQIVNLCHAMGAEVIVEGIETEAEYKAVRETGATYAQGYFVAKPMKHVLPPISVEVRQVPPKA